MQLFLFYIIIALVSSLYNHSVLLHGIFYWSKYWSRVIFIQHTSTWLIHSNDFEHFTRKILYIQSKNNKHKLKYLIYNKPLPIYIYNIYRSKLRKLQHEYITDPVPNRALAFISFLFMSKITLPVAPRMIYMWKEQIYISWISL